MVSALLSACDSTLEIPSFGDELAAAPELESGLPAGVSMDDGGLSPVSPASPVTESDDQLDEAPNTVFSPAATDINDNLSLYTQDGYAQNSVIRIDLVTHTQPGICIEGDQSGCTFADVLADTNSQDEFKVEIPVHYSADDYADDGLLNNAQLRQRGGGTRAAEQKSFRVKIDDVDQLWRGERHLQLNKHPFDSSRIRNKLSFDLMSTVPHLPSFRTQFVNLWIDDGPGPVNQGLYTHVERGDRRYLQRRGLDTDARLYKANFFRFRPSDVGSLRIDDDGEPLDQKVFERVLEIKNGENHRPLLKMLAGLHDPDVSFQSVMDRHFNANNVLSWIAVNLLLGQQDVSRHNFFLYNPSGSERFYFLPWDYDMAFMEHRMPANELSNEALQVRLGYGYAAIHENIFLNQYYRQPGAHKKIVAAVDEIRSTFLDDARIRDHVAQLAEVSSPFASVLPDIAFNEFHGPSSYRLAEKVALNHEAIHTRFGIPLPPSLDDPVYEAQAAQWRFDWSAAHDVTGNQLTYELQISSGPEFRANQITLRAEGIDAIEGRGTFVIADEQLPAGSYYVRLFARSVIAPQTLWQVADNDDVVVDGVILRGVVRFDVPD